MQQKEKPLPDKQFFCLFVFKASISFMPADASYFKVRFEMHFPFSISFPSMYFINVLNILPAGEFQEVPYLL